MKFITVRDWYRAKGYVEVESPIPGMSMIIDPEAPKDTIVFMDLDRNGFIVPDDWPNELT